MCEAIITSCSCNDEQKFGSLLEAFVANHIALGEQLPRGFTTELFGSVWDLPICSFYGDSSNPAFAGTPPSIELARLPAWVLGCMAAATSFSLSISLST